MAIRTLSAVAARSNVTQAEYELLAELRWSLRTFLAFSEDAARRAGVTPAQHQALLAMRASRAAPLSIRELATRLCVKHHSAVELVDRLIARGLARRLPDPEDRRRVRLALSARGERVLEKLATAHRDELRRVGPQVEALLERLRASG